MTLPYDPAQGDAFWATIKDIPGYPTAGIDIPTRVMLFESGALFKLPEVLAAVGADPSQPVLVPMDPTPMQRGQDSLKPLVLDVLREAGWGAEQLVFEPDASGQVHCDVRQIDAVKERLHEGMAVVSVGSGAVTDTVKQACHFYEEETGYHVPYVCYQTANSVVAYLSHTASVTIKGMKRTLLSRLPDALVCDLETLRDAPPEMAAAGVGDLVAAFISLPDWFMANRLGMDETYTEFVQRLMGPLDDILLEKAEAIRSGSLEGTAVLAKLLSLGALSMSVSGVTTPMSGFEHGISHVLDLQGGLEERPLALHGLQVALATIMAAEVYRRLLTELEPAEVNVDACYPSTGTMRERIEKAFAEVDPSGKTGQEVWEIFQKKLDAWHGQRDKFEAVLSDWPSFREKIEETWRTPERTAEILRAVDSPMSFDALTPPIPEEQVKFAFMNGVLMRGRFTIGDLLLFLQWDRETLWQQVWDVSQKMAEQA